MDSKIPLSIRLKSFQRKTAKFVVSFFVTILKKIFLKQRSGVKINTQAKQQKEFDKKLVYSLSRSRVPTWRQFKYLKKYLSVKERKVILISLALIIINSLFVGGRFYFTHLETSPIEGGEYSEALIGSLQTINPLYGGRNDVDDDFTRLIFSSLFKRGKVGELEKDLVDDFFVSPDSKTYEFTIKSNVKWHNGDPLTVDDIIFTFNAITDPLYKSSLRQSFVGVKIEKIDEHSFKFLLPNPYAAFLDLLTFGILPANLWSQIQPETANLAALNLKPIGSGPYRAGTFTKDEATGAIKEYKLIANHDYYGKVPYLDLNFKFYANFEEAINALNNNEVNGISYLPKEMKESLATPKTLNFHEIFFPQITLIFLNQETNPALADKAVRQALSYAIDRRAIVNDVLNGGAYIVDSPILANSFAYNNNIKKYTYDQKKAEELLDSVDWKLETIDKAKIEKAQKDLNSEDDKIKTAAQEIISLGEGNWRKKNGKYLEIKLSTVERKENSKIIEAVKRYWQKIGIKVNTVVMPGNLVQGEVIRPRNFEALFYAQVLGADPDPYAFWHSSQAKNGFNIADFSNKKVDQLLEDARLTAETGVRQKKYKEFQEIIAEDEPVIFMYSPYYTYVQDKNVKGFDVQSIVVPSDRLANVSDWYMKTGRKLDWKK